MNNQVIKAVWAIGMVTVLAGCAGCLGPGYYGPGYYDEGVVVSDPDVYLFGGGYDNGRDVHNYSNRGSESRGASRPGASHGAAHAGGGGGARR